MTQVVILSYSGECVQQQLALWKTQITPPTTIRYVCVISISLLKYILINGNKFLFLFHHFHFLICIISSKISQISSRKMAQV